MEDSEWTVEVTGKAVKQARKLPGSVAEIFEFLLYELRLLGPERHNWPHYGRIVGKTDMHHCHLNKGKPRYVAVWKVTDRNVQCLEIRYVGTHENADYRLID